MNKNLAHAKGRIKVEFDVGHLISVGTPLNRAVPHKFHIDARDFPENIFSVKSDKNEMVAPVKGKELIFFRLKSVQL